MSDSRPFAHLHCHTHFSLLDGANRIPDLVQKIKNNGMNALAITDHGNLYGAIEFYNTCKAHEINPVLGYEAYVAPGSRTYKKATSMREASYHLTLLAMNRTGFQNLVKMASSAYLDGFYYKPRIDKELLEAHSDGLICLSGCASSELSHLILGEKMDEARNLLEWYVKVFGDRFYMEIQNAGLEVQKLCADGTIDLANEMGLPLVATNDAHYLNREDADAHDVLLCVNTRSLRSDVNRMKMENDEFFVRTPEQMYAAFPDHPDAVARTQEIAERVDIDLDLSSRHFPVFTPPENKTDTQYLRELCEEGMNWRYGDEMTEVHQERLDYELSVIEQMGYSSYFLIVWDFVRFALENEIPCQARGSACGSVVAYVLGLSNVCPLKYDLLFERFLDPSREEPPDIDIDFCRDGRQSVIDYTKKKYGEQNVAQIGTFGTLKAKAAIRDVSRALGVPLHRVDEICKMVPETLNIKLEQALKESDELRKIYHQDPQIKEMLDIAQRLEDLARSAGTHAAGVVVADEPISNYIPLQTITGKTDIITQWDGPTVEKIGLLKMDFLGLRNLTILDKAVRNVKKHHPDQQDLDPLNFPMDDAKTFALLQRGETKGIFQLESGGMRDLLTKMKPDSFLDIIATSALYRPGPLEGGMVMDYVNVKNGLQEPARVHPIVDEILEETYGVMVYQEQVMRILNQVGGIELPAAYRCIKAISKKKLKTIAQFREQYLEGAGRNGIDEKLASELFGLIEKFAGYGFNKSHSTAYGAVAYQTAYLKAHYPKEFMAALLSCGMESSDRISEQVDDCRRMGLEVLPPDVNRSDVEFGILGEKMTFGLGAIKGIGKNAVAAVVRERKANGPYGSIFDLTERVDTKLLNRSALEILIKAGALDSLGPNPAQHMLVVDRAVQSAVALNRDRASGQKSLFGGDDETETAETLPVNLPEAPDWSHREKLAAEKEVFGFYLTSHPMAEHAGRLTRHATDSTMDLADLDDGTEVLLGGMISSIKRASTKKPSRNGHSTYVNFDFEDSEGIVRCIMWPEQFARQGDRVTLEAICFVKGKVDRRSREPNVIVDRILTPEEADKEFTQQLSVKFQRGLHTEQDMIRVRDVLNKNPGRTEVLIVVDSAGEIDPGSRLRYSLSTRNDLRVACGDELQQGLHEILGEENVRFLTGTKQKGGRTDRSRPQQPALL
ncbi:MAG: DNA polymerase III subunit alpha [Planctomycetes bacterium]|nr:DNA polymerase III subunit alpha [Planctomycetota bacterium]